jgi:ATP-dependent Clp protease ATP-binding subunit ClpA
MFERYTESARRTLFFARYEASELGSISIDPEHLLLGLLRDSRALSTLTQVSPEALRHEITTAVVVNAKLSTSVEIPFTNASKQVLQFAAEEADALRHDVRQAVKNLPGRLGVAPQSGMPEAIDGIKSMVADLAGAPRDSREARDLVTRIHAALDALLNDSGLR